ncbi:hypothetical protein NST81_09415 [Bacillus sp. FSL W8-0223]|uniref:hypothetical protein n=1 Tax=Bacillus sp. FSL W8-0223 TaxID=2954595 RepID=UPI0030F4E2A1
MELERKFYRSIINYSSVVDIHMVLDEILDDLQSQVDKYEFQIDKYTTRIWELKDVMSMIEKKKVEIEDRYSHL